MVTILSKVFVVNCLYICYDTEYVDNIHTMGVEIVLIKSNNCTFKILSSQLFNRFVGEKVKQNSSYELLQLKHDLETYKHQKTKAENECDELQKENTDLENQLL